MTAEPIPARRAGLYMRISMDATGERLGVDRQEQDCRELADRLGWDVAEVYVDNDISAYKKRPGYERLLDDIRAGAIDAVIAWAPDRIYRRIVDLEHLIGVIEAHGVQVATVKAGELDLGSAYGRMIARILGSVASGEGEIKAERWKRSNQQRREAGMKLRTGSRLFGYDADMNVIEHEAAVARVMAAKIREGGSILGVCRWLDEQGVRATRGSAWTPQSVKRYLTNPRLAGYSTLNGEIVAEGTWEPILDRETWETVRAMLTARTRAHVPRKALLLDLIYCGKCGHRLITSAGRKKGSRNYRCPKRPGMDGCGRLTIMAEPVEQYVEGYAERRLSDPAVRKRIAELHAHPAEYLTEINALDLRVRELEAQLDEPGVPVEALLRGIQRAKDRRTELAEKLAARGTAPLPPVDAPWPEDLMRRRALVDLVVERIDLLPADMTKPRGFDAERVQISER